MASKKTPEYVYSPFQGTPSLARKSMHEEGYDWLFPRFIMFKYENDVDRKAHEVMRDEVLRLLSSFAGVKDNVTTTIHYHHNEKVKVVFNNVHKGDELTMGVIKFRSKLLQMFPSKNLFNLCYNESIEQFKQADAPAEDAPTAKL